MIKVLMQRLFGRPVAPTSQECRTERLVNIVGTKEEWWREGFDTNSIFRVRDEEQEKFLLRDSEFVIEAVAAEASILTCCLSQKLYEYGCYSLTDIEEEME